MQWHSVAVLYTRTYLQGKLQQPAVDLSKMFKRQKYNLKEAIPGDGCLANIIGMCDKRNALVHHAF